MEKLAEVLSNTADFWKDGAPGNPGSEALQKAAEEWATASLKVFTGKLLGKALGISAAVANFLSELEACEKAAVKP